MMNMNQIKSLNVREMMVFVGTIGILLAVGPRLPKDTASRVTTKGIVKALVSYLKRVCRQVIERCDVLSMRASREGADADVGTFRQSRANSNSTKALSVEIALTGRGCRIPEGLDCA
jgi:hypothetical protein